jgi:Flp pilus assembly protein TadD
MIESGEARKAAALLEPYTEKDPRNPRLWHQLGKALGAASDYDGAERALRRAIELDGRSDFIRYTYADVLGRKGDAEGARAQLEGILASNPRAVDAALDLSMMAMAQKDLARAESILRASYASGARDPDQLDALATVIQRTTPGGASSGPRSDEAARLFAEALTLRPDDPTALLETGRAALRGGDAPKAIRLLGSCASSDRAFECRMELARAYVLGPRDLEAARTALRSAREAAPDEASRAEVDGRLAAIESMARWHREPVPDSERPSAARHPSPRRFPRCRVSAKHGASLGNVAVRLAVSGREDETDRIDIGRRHARSPALHGPCEAHAATR